MIADNKISINEQSLSNTQQSFYNNGKKARRGGGSGYTNNNNNTNNKNRGSKHDMMIIPEERNQHMSFGVSPSYSKKHHAPPPSLSNYSRQLSLMNNNHLHIKPPPPRYPQPQEHIYTYPLLPIDKEVPDSVFVRRRRMPRRDPDGQMPFYSMKTDTTMPTQPQTPMRKESMSLASVVIPPPSSDFLTAAESPAAADDAAVSEPEWAADRDTPPALFVRTARPQRDRSLSHVAEAQRSAAASLYGTQFISDTPTPMPTAVGLFEAPFTAEEVAMAAAHSTHYYQEELLRYRLTLLREREELSTVDQMKRVSPTKTQYYHAMSRVVRNALENRNWCGAMRWLRATAAEAGDDRASGVHSELSVGCCIAPAWMRRREFSHSEWRALYDGQSQQQLEDVAQPSTCSSNQLGNVPAWMRKARVIDARLAHQQQQMRMSAATDERGTPALVMTPQQRSGYTTEVHSMAGDDDHGDEDADAFHPQPIFVLHEFSSFELRLELQRIVYWCAAQRIASFYLLTGTASGMIDSIHFQACGVQGTSMSPTSFPQRSVFTTKVLALLHNVEWLSQRLSVSEGVHDGVVEVMLHPAALSEARRDGWRRLTLECTEWSETEHVSDGYFFCREN